MFRQMSTIQFLSDNHRLGQEAREDMLIFSSKFGLIFLWRYFLFAEVHIA